MKIPSQRERLIAFFDSGKTLTRLTAWDELGILECPARLSELRAQGYPIVTKMITVKNRYGESVRVAEWRKEVTVDSFFERVALDNFLNNLWSDK